jgi:hypothetical protein
MMRPDRALAYALILAIALLGAVAAEAEDTSPKVTLFPTLLRGDPSRGGAVDEESAAVYSAALRSSLKLRLGEAGYSVVEDGESLEGGFPEAAEASSRAAKAGSSFAAVCELSLTPGRIAYRIAIYDATDASLGAGDGFSAFSGLAALSLLDGAAARSVEKLAAYDARRPGIARRLVGYRLVVLCPIEGAEVSVELPGSSAPIRMGRISGGRLELPYYPFVQGTTLTVAAAALGRRTLRASVALGAESPPSIELSEGKPRYDLLLGTGTGRLMGLGGELRFFPGSEWLFGFAEARLYAGYDFQQGSSPLVHTDIWEGLGSYLFFPPPARFRMGYSMGYGILVCTVTAEDASDRQYCDFALLPVELFGEYRLKGNMCAWTSLRFAYALGTALLPKGWIGGGAPALSIGALWRKR